MARIELEYRVPALVVDTETGLVESVTVPQASVWYPDGESEAVDRTDELAAAEAVSDDTLSRAEQIAEQAVWPAWTFTSGH